MREVLSGRTDGQSDIARAIARPAGAPGWFAPGDAIWTVHGSVATFVGGIRSLYLQALHPLAIAGVDRHSTYREDPSDGCSARAPSWPPRPTAPRTWPSRRSTPCA